MTKPQPSPSLTTGGEIQLKPCPFCGGVEEVSFRIERTPSGMREVPFFICGACAAEGAKPVASWVRDTGDPDEMRAAAIAAWNRRAYIELVENRGGVRAEIERLVAERVKRPKSGAETNIQWRSATMEAAQILMAISTLQSNSSGGVGGAPMAQRKIQPRSGTTISLSKRGSR